MELRKIHRTGEGRSSYFLTIPHDLIKALNIGDGDYVSLFLQEGRIVVVPVQERESSIPSERPA